MADEIEHEGTAEVVCPWCGHEFTDSWELPDEGEEECPVCWKHFKFYRDVTVDYATEKDADFRGDTNG